MKTIQIDELKTGMPGITPIIGEYLYENVLAGMHLSSNGVAARIKVKEQQITQSDDTQLPAYISVVELSCPKAYFNKM
ncbi:MAG: hypothetical protein KBT20_06095 [Bacteroidales bacterium]|nr:hypothetical protein [Candidatus Liminaster caballi]